MGEIVSNFMIANYDSNQAVDNDDGSAFYRTHGNFLVYGLQSALKSDVGGHSNEHFENIVAYVKGECFGICEQLKGFNDAFFNNTCVINSNDTVHYGSFSCSASQSTWPKLGNNSVWTLATNVSAVGLCGLSEVEFQAKYGADLGTVVQSNPDNEAIVQQAKR